MSSVLAALNVHTTLFSSVVSQKYVEEVLSITGRARVSEELYSGNLFLLMKHDP
jgi:hypothetical protein